MRDKDRQRIGWTPEDGRLEDEVGGYARMGYGFVARGLIERWEQATGRQYPGKNELLREAMDNKNSKIFNI